MIRRLPLAALLGLLAVSPALADDDDGPSLDDIPHITIVATAQTDVRPDLATITLGVTTEKPSASAAADDNARKSQAVIDAAKAQGVPAIDISTQSVNLTQTFDEIRDKDGRVTGQKPRGFAVENIVAIRLRDLTKAGTIAESLITKGANRFDGIAFSVEHPEPVVAKLAGTAVKNARAQAQAAAEAAGVRLGRVLTIEAPSEESAPRAGFSRRMKMAAAPSPPMPLEAGTQTFSAVMSVTWAIEPK